VIGSLIGPLKCSLNSSISIDDAVASTVVGWLYLITTSRWYVLINAGCLEQDLLRLVDIAS